MFIFMFICKSLAEATLLKTDLGLKMLVVLPSLLTGFWSILVALELEQEDGLMVNTFV